MFLVLGSIQISQSQWWYTSCNDAVLLEVRNAARERTTILQLPVMEARQTLGVQVAPDGNNDAEFKHLMQIASEWFTAMKGGQLTHAAAEFSLCNVVLKQLAYPLGSTTFTQKQYQVIMWPILVAGLPAMGVVRTMVQEVVHGPWHYQGLEVPNLYTEQTIAQLSTLLQYRPQEDDVTGSLIQYTAEAFQLEAGISSQLFEVPAQLAPAVTDLWIKECWLDMIQHDIHIRSDIPNMDALRVGDEEIMQAILQAGFHNEELAAIN